MLEGLSTREQYFYKEVARMVSRINSNRSTVKTEVYRTKTPLRYYPLLHKVILNYTHLHELAGKVGLDGDGEEVGAILAYEISAGNLSDDKMYKDIRDKIGPVSFKAIEKQVYVRINTLKADETTLRNYNVEKTCVPDVYRLFPPSPATLSSEEYASSAKKSIKEFYTDPEVKDKVKFQNLSSCLPAFILNPPQDATVIDATAAPGNKTTQLCSIMGNTGTIYAFERNAKRFQILLGQIENYGATNIVAEQKDFLKVTPEECHADYIMLDPSCSGSGIHLNYVKDQERIDGLHNIQAMLLNHAFTFKPKRVVYSTCSVHAEEGEDVVKEALEKNQDYEIVRIGDFWEERGYPGYEFSEDVIRANRNSDGTVGFFVALFRKKEDAHCE